MEWFVYLHVLSVVIWVGGVAFVTTIVFPVLARMEDSMAKVSFFILEKSVNLTCQIEKTVKTLGILTSHY